MKRLTAIAVAIVVALSLAQAGFPAAGNSSKKGPPKPNPQICIDTDPNIRGMVRA